MNDFTLSPEVFALKVRIEELEKSNQILQHDIEELKRLIGNEIAYLKSMRFLFTGEESPTELEQEAQHDQNI